MINAFLRSFEEPAGASHVCVSPAEHVGSWMIADKFEGLFEVFESRLVISLVNLRDPNAEIRLGQTAPVTILTKTLQGALRVVSGNRVFIDSSIRARQRGVNVAQVDYAGF